MSLIEDNYSFIFDSNYEGNTNPEDFNNNFYNFLDQDDSNEIEKDSIKENLTPNYSSLVRLVNWLLILISLLYWKLIRSHRPSITTV